MGNRNILVIILLVQVLSVILCTCQSYSNCAQYIDEQRDRSGNYITNIRTPGKIGSNEISVHFRVQGRIYDDGSLDLLYDKEDTTEEIQRNGRMFWKLHLPFRTQKPIITTIYVNGQLYCKGPNPYISPNSKYEASFNFNFNGGGNTYSNTGNTNSIENHIERTFFNSVFGRDPDWESNDFSPLEKSIFNIPYRPNLHPNPIHDHDLKSEESNNFFSPQKPNNNRPYRPNPQPNPFPDYDLKPEETNYIRPPERPNNNLSTEKPTILPRVPPTPSMEREKSTVQWVENISQNCGRSDEMQRLIPTVISGKEVTPGQFPWLVYLHRQVGSHCGASLVSNSFVITAAHCVKGLSNVTLLFGKHDLTDDNEKGSMTRMSNKITMHPNYTKGAHADIALVSFDPIKFSNTILPVCLWAFEPSEKTDYKSGTVAGWGQVYNNGGNPTSDLPKFAWLRKKDSHFCGNETEVPYDTFCVGNDGKGNDMSISCYGDSGGGFYALGETGSTWYLHGVISHSIGLRHSCNPMAVYVNIWHHLNWLQPYLYPYI